jgi:hypothetical protein
MFWVTLCTYTVPTVGKLTTGAALFNKVTAFRLLATTQFKHVELAGKLGVIRTITSYPVAPGAAGQLTLTGLAARLARPRVPTALPGPAGILTPAGYLAVTQ